MHPILAGKFRQDCDSREGMTTRRDKSIKALIAGCREGNKQDWAELIDRVSPAVFSACYRFRLSREESYDVFGKVSLLLLENLNNLRDDEKVFGYVSTVAYHEATAIKTRSKIFDSKAQDIKIACGAAYEGKFMRPQVEKDEEPDTFQCQLVFQNTSDFMVRLVNADVWNPADESQKFVDIDPGEIPELPADASWYSNFWEFYAEDGEPEVIVAV